MCHLAMNNEIVFILIHQDVLVIHVQESHKLYQEAVFCFIETTCLLI